MFSYIKSLYQTVSYIPAVVTNKGQEVLHTLFPNSIAKVCVYDSDFVCQGTKGVAKLANVLPTPIMELMDTLYQNPLKTIGSVALIATGGTLLYYYGCRHRPLKTSQIALGSPLQQSVDEMHELGENVIVDSHEEKSVHTKKHTHESRKATKPNKHHH